MDKDTYLVVGGDSLVGAGVISALKRRGKTVTTTTRKKDTVGPGRLYLDFESWSDFRIPSECSFVYLVAAATSLAGCETDPRYEAINTDFIPKLISSFLSRGLFTCFVSTNSVFGGQKAWPKEDDEHQPGFAYSRQKSVAESRIRQFAREHGVENLLSIVRLTKTIDHTVPPIPAWVSAWKAGKPVEPFTDFIFAPMSVRYASEAFATFGELRTAGNLHLSGAANISYYDFALAMAERLHVKPHLISASTATEKGVSLLFKPRYSALSMDRTTALTGIKPQPLDGVISDLMSELAATGESVL